ncbi:UEV domain-containing protein [Coprinopsis sp. MPI-PUGE-AT-0042]|nr:UEV domain-containing protein [Coprinopsis sp. MPI-PUGE-AT-0042]
MAESLTQKWLRQAVAVYPNKERAYLDVDTVLSRYPTLRPKTEVYTFDDGRTQVLLCVHGLLPITYRSAAYNIPVNIWLTRDFPKHPPLVYVVPTSDMLVKSGKYLDVSGRCTPEYLQLWERKHEGCNLLGLVHDLQEQFSREPPVYAKPKQATPSVSQTSTPPPVPARPSSSVSPSPSHNLAPLSPPRPPPAHVETVNRPANTFTPPHGIGIPPADPRPTPPPPPPLPPQLVAERNRYAAPYSTPTRLTSPPVTQSPPPPPPPPPDFSSTSNSHLYPVYRPPPVTNPTAYEGPSISPNAPTQPIGAPPHPPLFIQQQKQQFPILHPATPARQTPIPNLLDDDDMPTSDLTVGPSKSAPEQIQVSSAPPRPPNPELLELHRQVHHRLTSELQSLSQALAIDAERLRAHQTDLLAGQPAIRDEMARLEAVRDICRGVAERTKDAVQKAESNVTQLKRKGDPEVDELVCATSIVHNQLINLVAEDNAIEDTVYHLHRALNCGRIDLERFLRSTRVLAEEQFAKRALINKIVGGMSG